MTTTLQSRVRRGLFAAALAVIAVLPAAGVSAASAPAATSSRVFVSVMTGAQQVPAVQTEGIAAAAFEVSSDRKSIRFELAAANLSSNITQAHIHLGAAGTNGPVVVFLVRPTSVSGQEFFTSGTFTAADQVGPLAGSATLDTLIQALGAGTAYVNVHTVNHPAGEVRGQTRAIGED
jgi:hypothetical protein